MVLRRRGVRRSIRPRCVLLVATMAAAVTVTGRPGRAGAEEGTATVLPCRPTIACTAEIVPGGTFEVEFGYSARLSHGPKEQNTPFLLKMSLTDRVQLQLGGIGARFPSGEPASFGAISPAVKVLLRPGGERGPAFALSLGLGVPVVADEDWSRRSYEPQLVLYLSQNVAGFHVDVNAAIHLAGIPQGLQPYLWAAIATSRELPAHFGFMWEVYGYSAALAPADLGLLLAVSYQPRPWVIFDAGLDVGALWQTRAVTFFAGLTMAAGRTFFALRPATSGTQLSL